MAKKSEEEKEEKASKGSGIMGLLVALVVVTIIAGGAGYATSTFVLKPSQQIETATETPSEDGEEKESNKETEDEKPVSVHIRSLEPILTNLAAPQDVWIRMELSVASDVILPELVAEQVHQALFAFMRASKLQHLQGPSGYHHLKSELTLRARQSSDGLVRDVLVRTLLFE